MGAGFLAPLFLAGFGLLVIPWLVHQIRRPEEKPVRFSSLLFVPQTRKRVVRRRKIQHLLLMLLRMALLALLALAFMRPYWLAPATGAAAKGETVRHVILLDTSYSMGARSAFEEARAQALLLLDHFGAGDRVAVITFDAAPHILAPLDSPSDPEAGSLARARQAIRSAALGYQTTAYLPALQSAQSLLLGPDSASNISALRAPNSALRLMLHLLTDFQHAGMPEGSASWKLSSRIELQAIEVGAPAAPAPNCGLADLAIEEGKPGQLRLRAKVRNWSAPAGQSVAVTLVTGGQNRETRSVTIKPGNATQVAFTLPNPTRGPVEGQVELADDALAADNRYYFAWNPRPRHDLLLVSYANPLGSRTASSAQTSLPPSGHPESPNWERGRPRPIPPSANQIPNSSPQGAAEGGMSSSPSQAARFLQLALPESPDLPWTVREATPSALPAQLAAPARAPELLLATNIPNPASARALLDYVRAGGNALLLLGAGETSATLNPALLAPLGLATAGPRTARPNESSFLAISWVDLDHRIFLPFRDPRSSDFSSLHFFNSQSLSLAPCPGAPTPHVLARLDDGSPLIVECRLGQGTILLWAFDLDLSWTNLPKKGTFVPLLHETLAYLTRTPAAGASRRVGELVSAPPALDNSLGSRTASSAIRPRSPNPVSSSQFTAEGAASWLVQPPGAPAPRPFAAQPPLVLDRPGLLRWKAASDPAGAPWRQVESVNVDPREGDPLRVSIPEFKLRLCSAAPERPAPEPRAVAAGADDRLVKREWGHPVLGVLLLALLFESLYAARLAARAGRKDVEVAP